MSDTKLPKFTEFETKYLTSIGMLNRFKKIAESLPTLLSFQYSEGPDYFYENTNLPNTFVRFRRSSYPDKDGIYYQQLTSKTKAEGASSSRERKEPNLMVSGGSVEEVSLFAESIGFKLTHSITKRCHIYYYPDATLVFYSVRTPDMVEPDDYIEIEVDETTIHNLTKSEAVSVIEKYEEILSSIEGVSAKKRLKLSLRERYRK